MIILIKVKVEMNKSISTTIIIAILGIILVSSIGTNTEKLVLSTLKFQHKTNVDVFNSILGYFGIQLAHAADDGDSGDGGGDSGDSSGGGDNGDSGDSGGDNSGGDSGDGNDEPQQSNNDGNNGESQKEDEKNNQPQQSEPEPQVEPEPEPQVQPEPQPEPPTKQEELTNPNPNPTNQENTITQVPPTTTAATAPPTTSGETNTPPPTTTTTESTTTTTTGHIKHPRPISKIKQPNTETVPEDPNGNILPSKDEYEKEKAAIEDYIYDTPGKVKLYPTEGVKEPWRKKLIESLNLKAESSENNNNNNNNIDVSEKDPKKNDPCNYHGQDICDASRTGCDDKRFDCLSEDPGPGKYCTTGMCPGDDDGPNKPGDEPGKPYKPGWGECRDHHYNVDGKGGKGKDDGRCGKGDGGGGGGGDDDGERRRCHNGHGPHCDRGDGDRDGRSYWCKHHDCHEHHHHSSTHYSDSHYGDVTVEINAKYEETNPNNLEDVDLIIGDVHDEVLDLSDKPSEIRVDNLDIDGGDTFAVCLANEASQQGDCTVTEADSDHSTEIVYLTVY